MILTSAGSLGKYAKPKRGKVACPYDFAEGALAVARGILSKSSPALSLARAAI